jgi:hypothetical protein
MADASTATTQEDPVTASLRTAAGSAVQNPSVDEQLRMAASNALEPGFNPLSWVQSFLREAHAVVPQAIAGAAGAAADQFDPSARFADQSNQQIQDGIYKAQEELDRLQGQVPGPGQMTDEYGGSLLASRMAALQGDIAAMHRAIEKRTPGGEQATTGEQIGQTLLDVRQRGEAVTQMVRGERAIPRTGTAWDNVSDFVNAVTQAAPAPDVLHREDPITRFSGMLGQWAGMAPLAAGGLPLEAGGFAAIGSEAGRQEAEQAGGNLAQQAEASQWGVLSGILQSGAAHYVFNGLLPDTMPRTVGELQKHILKSAAVGAVTGAAQQVGDNLVAQTSQYDPKRRLDQNLWTSIWQNALVMGVTGATLPGASFALRALTDKPNNLYTARETPEQAATGQPTTAGAPEAAQPTTRAQAQAELEA